MAFTDICHRCCSCRYRDTWTIGFSLYLLVIIFQDYALAQTDTGFPCTIPSTMQGRWYSYEDGQSIESEISESSIIKTFTSSQETVTTRCLGQLNSDYDVEHNYFLMENQDDKCRQCVAMFYRSRNVLEYKFSTCQNFDTPPGIGYLCPYIFSSGMTLYTLFAVTTRGENCRSSFEGIYQFQYEKGDDFAGPCFNPKSNITACQTPGSFFNEQNQRFLMNWKSCGWNSDVEDAEIRYECLGQWTVENGNRYIAVANQGDERKFLKYRCMLTRSDQPLIMAMSDTATCNTLKNPRDGPFEIILTEVKSEQVEPRCKFPLNFTGSWIGLNNYDSKIEINSTHIYEWSQPDQQQPVRDYYLCQENYKNRYLVAKLGVGGCYVEYFCFDFLPRHHNVIRYRKSRGHRDYDKKKGQSFLKRVCSWNNFGNDLSWKYNVMMLANPYGVECPIRGKFTFQQRGDGALRKKPEVTESPRDQVDCREFETVWGSCSNEPTRIHVDVDRCATVDHRAKPIGEYDIIDYNLMCVGYWKEDDRSYLITYDAEDPFSKFQCWIYRRLSYDEMRISKASRSFCHQHQTDASYEAKEGANLRLELKENERLFDNCPLHFDDASNPYKQEIHIQVFDNGAGSYGHYHYLITIIAIITITLTSLSS